MPSKQVEAVNDLREGEGEGEGEAMEGVEVCEVRRNRAKQYSQSLTSLKPKVKSSRKKSNNSALPKKKDEAQSTSSDRLSKSKGTARDDVISALLNNQSTSPNHG